MAEAYKIPRREKLVLLKLLFKGLFALFYYGTTCSFHANIVPGYALYDIVALFDMKVSA